MKKIIGILICMIAVNHLIAQSNPQIDRPVQQCISAQKDKIQRLKHKRINYMTFFVLSSRFCACQ